MKGLEKSRSPKLIDILKTEQQSQRSSNTGGFALIAVVAFIAWQSGYLDSLFPRTDREKRPVTASAVLLIKSSSMTSDQQYTANSPVLDEIADQRGIKFRVLDDNADDLSRAPGWVQQLFLENEKHAPCLALIDESGKKHRHDAPSSVSEFRERVGAK